MNAIKISVEVSVNLSENTQNFIKSLFTGVISAPQANVAQVKAAPAPQANVAQVKAAPAPQTNVAQVKAAPAPQANVAQVKATPASTNQSNKSIEDVRSMLAKKVNDHREAIKQKLNEFGAPSVTKLDPSKYDEMFNFLESL